MCSAQLNIASPQLEPAGRAALSLEFLFLNKLWFRRSTKHTKKSQHARGFLSLIRVISWITSLNGTSIALHMNRVINLRLRRTLDLVQENFVDSRFSNPFGSDTWSASASRNNQSAASNREGPRQYTQVG